MSARMSGLAAFAITFAVNAYRTAYVYPTIPQLFYVGDFVIAALVGLAVIWFSTRFGEPRA